MCANEKKPRRGLTLVELLVVLTILAVMTIIAVQSTDFLVDQARYDVTQQTLNNIQSAVLGAGNQANADSTSLAAGFVADIGRPPLAVANTDSSQLLAELWSNPLGLPAFASYGPAALTPVLKSLTTANPTLSMPPLYSPPGGSTQVISAQIQVMAGWRGPYLRMPPQAVNQLFDGWGNAYTLLQADMLTPVVPFQIGQTASFAGTNLVSFVESQGGPAAPYLGTLTTRNSFTNSSTTGINGLTGTITGSINNPAPLPPPSNAVFVLLFYPDMTQTPPINVAWAIASSAAGTGTTTGGGSGIAVGAGGAGYTFTFTGVPVGPRVLMAYQAAAGTNQVIQYVRVPPSGLTVPINSNFQ